MENTKKEDLTNDPTVVEVKATQTTAKTETKKEESDSLKGLDRFEKVITNLIEENELLRKSQQDLMNKMEAISSNINKPNIAKKIKEHFVRLSLFEGKIIIGFDGDFYNVWDEKRRTDILTVDLILEDKKKVVGVDVMKLLNSGKYVEAKILERKTNEVTKSDGVTNKAEFNGDYGMVVKDTIVDLESIKINTIFKVELPDGRQLEIDEKYVNIQ